MPEIVQWVVDTRTLWADATSTQDLKRVAPHALSLLSPVEQQKALGFVFIKDAKLSLVSSLLKRLLISRYARVPWNDAISLPDARKKPVFRSHPGARPVAFNVSHQDGLVVLAAVCGYTPAGAAGLVEVGVDVVSPHERRARDIAGLMAHAGGWAAHIDIYAEIFAAGEVAYLKALAVPPAVAASPEAEADYRLRYFYALWCLREAYVKMDGQALTAPWINDLEFRAFVPPPPGDGAVDGFDVRLHGLPERDARIELRSLGDRYMIGTAIRTPARPLDAHEFVLGPYQTLDLERELESVEVQQPEDEADDEAAQQRRRNMYGVE
ncbi:hypothetical protein TD95_002882 [Thielaviopsis punctulata]|uniref:holo-[acyl-carrier-protein] synthase n=1 Tax=Thielaviopsis punctulata TaxID=72032 RepID=A0A0F4ZDB7_9PEZI|nr:hypothetical protein TD95_002882 [Thielaviopsis punctulata]